jgi:hypothetical protein
MKLSWTLYLASLLVAFAKVAFSNDAACSDTESGSVVLGSDGRVFVCIGNAWGTICKDEFKEVDASVVCKQLGHSRFGPTIKPYYQLSTYYGPSDVLMDRVECSGSEQRLIDCDYRHSTDIPCDHSTDVAVSCLQRRCVEHDVRLANGSAFEGRVEICLEEVWTTICLDSWNRLNSRVVCRQLGYRSEGANTSGSNPGPISMPIYTKQFRCSGHERRLFDCEKSDPSPPPCNHNHDLTIQCNSTRLCIEGEVRLAGGNSSSGRVEVCANEEWGTVCGDGWSNTEARLVCRQLGFSRFASFAPAMGPTNPGSGFIHLRNVTCEGSEPNLLSCDHGNDTSDCSHETDAQVSCQPRVCENGDVCLADGHSQYEGRLEICYNEIWGTVCSNVWDSYEIKVACRELGFGMQHWAALEDNTFPAPPGVPVLLSGVLCDGDENDLENCRHNGLGVERTCDDSGDVNIRCGQCAENNLTLTPVGDGLMRVEICLNGRWGTVCGDESWDNNDAAVLCREFKLDNNGSQLSIRNSFPLLDSLPFVMEGVSCIGAEESIKDCSYSLSDGDCPSGLVAGVQCSAQLTPTPASPSPLPIGVASIADSPAERPSPVASPSSYLPSPSSYSVSETAADAMTVSASSYYTRDINVECKWPIPSSYLPSPSSYSVSETAADAMTVSASSYYTRDINVECKWPIPSSYLPSPSSYSVSEDITVEYCNFQLVFSGNIVCNEWLLHLAGTKLAKLSQGLASSLDKECDCGLTQDSLTLQTPLCLQQNQFVLPGLLSGTNSMGCRQIMEFLQSWAARGSEIVVEGVPLTTVKECSVFLEPREAPSCKTGNPLATDTTRKPLLEVVLLPGIISVLGAIVLALAIVVVCIVVFRVRKKKASVRLSQPTTNAYNMVAVSGQTDDGKIIEIYDSPDYCSTGIYEIIAEPLPPIPPNDDGYPPDPNPYLTSTFKTSSSPTANGSIPRQQHKPRDDQHADPGAGMYSYVDMEEIASRNRAPEYDVPTMDDTTGGSHYQPLQLHDDGPEYVEPPLDDTLGTVGKSHYQPLKLIEGNPGPEYDSPPLDNTANDSHYQPLQPALEKQVDPSTYTTPQVCPLATTVDQPVSGDSGDSTAANAAESRSNLQNYKELIVQENETSGEYASLNI